VGGVRRTKSPNTTEKRGQTTPGPPKVVEARQIRKKSSKNAEAKNPRRQKNSPKRGRVACKVNQTKKGREGKGRSHLQKQKKIAGKEGKKNEEKKEKKEGTKKLKRGGRILPGKMATHMS